MSYPDLIIASLIEIAGNSCGDLQGTLEFNPDADPPEYTYTGTGDFVYARCYQYALASGVTWRLQIRYTGGGNCNGLWLFQRTVNEDDPTGDYCRLVSGTLDCSAGKAAVTAD